MDLLFLTLNIECEFRYLIFNYVLQKGEQLIIIPLKNYEEIWISAVF